MSMKKLEFESILDLLDRIVTKIEGQHSDARDFGTGENLYRSEIHTVQAIGENKGINVTRLAEKMGVTKGATSQILNKLVKKGLVIKQNKEKNNKELNLYLTDKGWIGFNNHEILHKKTFEVVKEYYGLGYGQRAPDC